MLCTMGVPHKRNGAKNAGQGKIQAAIVAQSAGGWLHGRRQPAGASGQSGMSGRWYGPYTVGQFSVPEQVFQMKRPSGRAADQLRPIRITRNYTKHAEGSVLVEFGDTKVICTVSVESGVPRFLKGQGQGWLTAEYGMLPRATGERNQREASRGKQGGRTLEIQRLIGRSLRAALDMSKLGENTLYVDCDVIQADGGTRTASITGAMVALVDALKVIKKRGGLKGGDPLKQ